MKIVQKAVIKNKNKYLILLRPSNKKHFPNHWDLPGGKLDDNEDSQEGLKREVFEETNLRIQILNSVNIFEKVIKGVLNRFITYEAKLKSGELKLSDEHVDYMWATKEQILELEKVEPFIEHYFKT